MQTITPACPEDFDILTEIWEAAVRSSHHFLREEDIQSLKPLVRNNYLPHTELYLLRDETQHTVGFVGLSETVIEMLFIDPAAQGKGYGSALIRFAIEQKKRYKVDVNEQNETALRFYLQKGFQQTGRDPLDPQGNPFPILHLEFRKE